MSNESVSTYQLVATDVTGQKRRSITMPGNALWRDVTNQSAHALELEATAEGQPIIYHSYTMSGVTLLDADTVADVVSDQFIVREVDGSEETVHRDQPGYEVQVLAEMKPA